MISRFIASGERLWLTGRITSTTLGVLDSSFNPPNNAHLQLAQLLRNRYPECTLVLMLSTGNADKPAAPIAQLEHRLSMMQEFAKNLGDTVIALTSEPYFVAKSEALRAACPDILQVFAMGADTLVRLYDQKYYSEPVEQVMAEFYKWARILVLDRKPDGVSATQSIDYGFIAPQLANGNVTIQDCNDSTFAVSSSRARKLHDLDLVVPANVAEYIRKNKLYQDDSA